MYKVIAADVDGTLVKLGEWEPSKENVKTLFKAQEKGIKVVVTTGRPFQGLTPIVDALKIKEFGGYAIGFNGAVIYELPSGKIVDAVFLNLEYVSEVLSLAVEKGLNFMTYKDGYALIKDPEEKYLKFVSHAERLIPKGRNFSDEPVDFDIPKILISGEPEAIAENELIFKEKFGEYFNIFRSEPFLLEILPLNVDKRSALMRLIKILGIKREELMAIGDGYNDITMIEFAGLGVAMGNASDAVKAVADFVAPDTDNDGVSYAVKKFALQ